MSNLHLVPREKPFTIAEPPRPKGYNELCAIFKDLPTPESASNVGISSSSSVSQALAAPASAPAAQQSVSQWPAQSRAMLEAQTSAAKPTLPNSQVLQTQSAPQPIQPTTVQHSPASAPANQVMNEAIDELLLLENRFIEFAWELHKSADRLRNHAASMREQSCCNASLMEGHGIGIR